MTRDRGDQLRSGDARAIELSERVACGRGIRLDGETAKGYASKRLLSLEEAAAIVQGLVPLLPNTVRGLQYLIDFECEVGRLRRDSAAGVLAMPCKPSELAGWAQSVGVQLPAAFTAALLTPEALPSPPPPKVRPDQQDRMDCQALALNIWSVEKTLSIEEMLRKRQVASYTKKYSPDSVRKWLSKVDPRPPEHKRGPRRRTF